MTLEELQATNAATLQTLRAQGISVDPMQHPYYGYYTVDLFECPSFVMFTNNDCPRGWDILFARHFEPQSMKVWCRLARTASGIVDIGAHVGVYSLAACALRQDIKVHAFEPNPNAYTRLRMHKIVNGFGNLIEHWFAVGHKDTQVPFSWLKKPTLHISSGGGVGKREGENIERIRVEQHKLDGTGIAQMVGDTPLVKIDVEGGEASTVQGTTEIFARNADVLLETFHQHSCDAINPFLKSQGYNVFKIFERRGAVEQVDMLRPCVVSSGDFNHLITRRSADEIGRLVA
jgi:FkbM family methyltransferase